MNLMDEKKSGFYQFFDLGDIGYAAFYFDVFVYDEYRRREYVVLHHLHDVFHFDDFGFDAGLFDGLYGVVVHDFAFGAART